MLRQRSNQWKVICWRCQKEGHITCYRELWVVGAGSEKWETLGAVSHAGEGETQVAQEDIVSDNTLVPVFSNPNQPISDYDMWWYPCKLSGGHRSSSVTHLQAVGLTGVVANPGESWLQASWSSMSASQGVLCPVSNKVARSLITTVEKADAGILDWCPDSSILPL